MKIQKPLLKWVGGKTQLINNIIDLIPMRVNNYHEIFLGGGSVLLAILSLQEMGDINIKGNIYAYDINKHLISLYNNIKNNPNDLYEKIKTYFDSYSKIKKNKGENESKEAYYYQARNKYNNLESSIDKSALFVFLNKSCFRGLYREGPNGFNVPFGHYKNINLLDKDELLRISRLIQNVKFINMEFKDSIKRAVDGDFLYLDPPYALENKTSFVKYTNDGFNIDKHKSLFKMVKKLNKKNINFLMSNSKVELVLNNFAHYNIIEIDARRAINSKKPESKTKEVLIYNYNLR